MSKYNKTETKARKKIKKIKNKKRAKKKVFKTDAKTGKIAKQQRAKMSKTVANSYRNGDKCSKNNIKKMQK